jgi:transcriptional regulator with XRE-family HTH domain
MPEALKVVSRIAALREKKGITQLELSRLVGVTETTIQNWEKSRAGVEQIERLIKLCNALDCKLEDLIEYRPDPDAETVESKPKERLRRMRQLLGTDKPAHATSNETTSEPQAKVNQ